MVAAKTASQLLDVSFNRSDEKMSGYNRIQMETSRRGTQSLCFPCVATKRRSNKKALLFLIRAAFFFMYR